MELMPELVVDVVWVSLEQQVEQYNAWSHLHTTFDS